MSCSSVNYLGLSCHHSPPASKQRNTVFAISHGNRGGIRYLNMRPKPGTQISKCSLLSLFDVSLLNFIVLPLR